MSAQMKQVSVTTMDGIAVVQIDNPPVNALSREVREELPAVVARLADDAAIDAIVVVGAGRTFVAGADIKELEQAAWSTRRTAGPSRSAAPRRGGSQADRHGDPRHARSAAGWNLRWPGTIVSRFRTRGWVSRRSISASFQAPKGRSG